MGEYELDQIAMRFRQLEDVIEIVPTTAIRQRLEEMAEACRDDMVAMSEVLRGKRA